MPLLLWKTDLNQGRVLVAASRVIGDNKSFAAAFDNQILLFIPEDGEYLPSARIQLDSSITAIQGWKPGLAQEGVDQLVASTAETIFWLSGGPGRLSITARTDPETSADFVDIATGDLDRDGIEEVVAAASGMDSIFVYRPVAEPETALELVGIRLVPGTPRFVEVLTRPEMNPAIAVVYEREGQSGLALFSLTDDGFEAGPVLEGLPLGITGLATGNFLPQIGDELAIGGPGGMVWLLQDGGRIDVLMVTESLGASISALASTNNEMDNLIAGTPGGYVFVFRYPVKRSPDLAFNVGEGISSLQYLGRERLVVGTTLGGVQVWSLANGEQENTYIVGSGDSLWSIAERFGVSVEQILALNPSITNRNIIMPGQIIKIPVP